MQVIEIYYGFILTKLFFNSTFLIFFRSLIAHAKSLLNLHRKLITIQENDKYVLENINLIGHSEFGKGKKFFTYKKFQEDILNSYDENKIEYWIQQWIYTYEWILETYNKSKYSN